MGEPIYVKILVKNPLDSPIYADDLTLYGGYEIHSTGIESKTSDVSTKSSSPLPKSRGRRGSDMYEQYSFDMLHFCIESTLID